MNKWVLALVATFLAGSSQASDESLNGLQDAVTAINKAAPRLKGRVLGLLIQPGMEQKHVDKILGTCAGTQAVTMIGGSVTQISWYNHLGIMVKSVAKFESSPSRNMFPNYELGLTVDFMREGDHRMRVTEVEYLQLFNNGKLSSIER